MKNSSSYSKPCEGGIHPPALTLYQHLRRVIIISSHTHNCVKTLALTPLLLALSAGFAVVAQAHEKNDVIIRLRISGTNINKDQASDAFTDIVNLEDSGSFSAKIKNDTAPALNVTWLFTDKLGLDVAFTSYKHNVRADFSDEEVANGELTADKTEEVRQDLLEQADSNNQWGSACPVWHRLQFEQAFFAQYPGELHPRRIGFWILELIVWAWVPNSDRHLIAITCSGTVMMHRQCCPNPMRPGPGHTPPRSR